MCRGMPNKWSVQGMFMIYCDGLTQNNKGKSNWGIMEEPRILTESIAVVPEIQNFFAHHRCEWMAASLDKYSPAMVR